MDIKCPTCGVIEDEVHFLTQCTHYVQLRKALFEYVSNYSCHFIDLSDVDKMIFLLSSEDNIIRAVAKYCYCAFEVRQAIV